MKKGILYYFIVFSALIHLLAIFSLKYIPRDLYRKDVRETPREPLVVDLMDQVKHGPKTILPKAEKDEHGTVPEPLPAKPAKDSPNVPQRMAKAVQPAPRPVPPAARPQPPRPAAVTPPPSARATPQSPPPARPRTGPEGIKPLPPEGGHEYQPPESPAAKHVEPQPAMPAIPGIPGGAGEKDAPRRLVQPTVEDLMRYAKVDPSVQRAEPDKGITLDTTDLMYTSYLQGMKKRIELIWKYPEGARRDGLQGDLVMRFTITKSGKVSDIELLKSSGSRLLDKAAEQALMDASPFNPLPDSWNKEAFTITGNFVYRLYGLYVQ